MALAHGGFGGGTFRGEMRAYYQRKVASGKKKLSVLNAICNKLVHRMMAVMERKMPYLALRPK